MTNLQDRHRCPHGYGTVCEAYCSVARERCRARNVMNWLMQLVRRQTQIIKDSHLEGWTVQVWRVPTPENEFLTDAQAREILSTRDRDIDGVAELERVARKVPERTKNTHARASQNRKRSKNGLEESLHARRDPGSEAGRLRSALSRTVAHGPGGSWSACLGNDRSAGGVSISHHISVDGDSFILRDGKRPILVIIISQARQSHHHLTERQPPTGPG
ncbi:hypothetical protein V8E53_001743 [Lactarius tabidus]